MIEFKQIIGRGTRTFEGKNYFKVYDFVKAHEKFDDKQWDGDPANIIVASSRRREKEENAETDETTTTETEATDATDDGRTQRPPMLEIKLANDHLINIAATTFWGLDGKPISAKQFIERMFGELTELFDGEDDLLAQWRHHF